MQRLVGIRQAIKDKLPVACLVSALVALSFVYGAAVDRYKIFPHPLLRAAYGAANEFWVWIEARLPQMPETYSVSPEWVHLSSTRGDLWPLVSRISRPPRSCWMSTRTGETPPCA